MKRDFGRILFRGCVSITVACHEATSPPPPSRLPAPLNVTALPGPTYSEVTVQWNGVPGATSYNLYWDTTANFTAQTGTKIGGVFSPFVHSSLRDKTTYYYFVTAVNDQGESAPSAQAQATASANIALGIIQPTPFARVDTQLTAVVVIQSRFQLAGVTASVSGRSTSLAFGPAPQWVGNLFLSGLSMGPLTLTVSATDVFSNNVAQSIAIEYDQRPRLTVRAPEILSVARPSIRVTASCQDDDPAGCKSVTVTTDSPFSILATGQGAIDQTVSLGSFDGREVFLTFEATDLAGQTTTEQREVFVESSNQLSEVDSVHGMILDALPDRILFWNPTPVDSALTIHDRASGTDMVVFNQGHPATAFLTPVGAMFVRVSANGVGSTLYDWENSVLTSFGAAEPATLVVKGPYAIWGAGPLTRRDFNLGQNVTIRAPGDSVPTTDVGNVNNDVAANGDVVWWSHGISYQVFRFRDTASTQLTNDSTLRNVYPVTDGINVVYTKVDPIRWQYQVALFDTSGEHILTPPDAIPRYHPSSDYQAVNGWVAYTRAGTAGESQVWSRSPTGQELQVTKFGTPSYISALGPNGEVAFVNGVVGSQRRYLAAPDYAVPRDIGSALGSASFQNGNLFIMIGRSLFQVSPHSQIRRRLP